MENVNITGYYPGVAGEVTRLHAVYYHEHWGFDLSFETQVGTELSRFLASMAPWDGFWAARDPAGRFLGSVAVDGGQEQGARLRWFIVDPAFQGRGLGRRLLSRAVEFSQNAGHESLFLWTFAGLDPARRLYESFGFALAEEHEARQWGNLIREQRFVRPGVPVKRLDPGPGRL
ncbi:MAG: GNAT family N-acetyltransferase [Proteobacteria bacterium]|nr:GNAT family N-acetyltransferase [Pseudomonadota bacterium]